MLIIGREKGKGPIGKINRKNPRTNRENPRESPKRTKKDKKEGQVQIGKPPRCPHGLGQLFMLFLANSALKCPNLCFVCTTAQPLQSLHLCCVFCIRSGQSSPQSAFVRPSLMRHRPALCFVPNFAKITSFSRFVPQNQFNLVALPQCHNFPETPFRVFFVKKQGCAQI